MKRGVKTLFIIFIVIAVLFIALALFLLFKGKAIAISKLQELTGKEVTIGYFSLAPLIKLEIKNLNIKDLAKVDYISVTPSILGFITGKVVLNDVTIIKPQIIFERAPVKTPAPSEMPAAAEPEKMKPKIKNLMARRINIKNGNLDFIDRSVSEKGIRVTFKDINFNLNNVYVFPSSLITNFKLKGRIPWQEGADEGKIDMAGWINLLKKDMQATVKIEDIDGIYLYPYYSTWVDLEKARIQKAKLNFTSDIEGQNNNVTAHCRLELTDIVRKPRLPEEEETRASRITDGVLGIFQAMNQGKIVLDFTIRTKMDRPEFGFSNIKMAFEDKLAQGRKADRLDAEEIMALPVILIDGVFRGVASLSKVLIDGSVAIGKEIKKTVRDALKKENKDQPINRLALPHKHFLC